MAACNGTDHDFPRDPLIDEKLACACAKLWAAKASDIFAVGVAGQADLIWSGISPNFALGEGIDDIDSPIRWTLPHGLIKFMPELAETGVS